MWFRATSGLPLMERTSVFHPKTKQQVSPPLDRQDQRSLLPFLRQNIKATMWLSPLSPKATDIGLSPKTVQNQNDPRDYALWPLRQRTFFFHAKKKKANWLCNLPGLFPPRQRTSSFRQKKKQNQHSYFTLCRPTFIFPPSHVDTATSS